MIVTFSNDEIFSDRVRELYQNQVMVKETFWLSKTVIVC